MAVCVESQDMRVESPDMRSALASEPSRSSARRMITAQEFEDGYAETVGTTVQQLHADGRAAEPCTCDWDLCRGWILGYARQLQESA